MQTSMKLLLTAPPDQCRAALRFGLPVAHVAYRVGGGPHLFRASIPVSVRGGLMVIDNTGFDGRGEAGPFCQEVLRECMARGYDGILCDFEGHPLQVLAQAVRTLGELTKKRGWPLYVTEAYAPFSDSAIALIPSALSGGSLQQRLQEAVERFGAARVALAVERVAEDFFLPSPTGQGMPSPGRSCASGWRNGLRRCSSPASCAPTTLPTCPGRTGPTSSCSTTQAPSARSSRWPAILASPAPCWPIPRWMISFPSC